ncbi:MAG TPA: hypothetical protein VGA99_05585, partial [bacterium]
MNKKKPKSRKAPLKKAPYKNAKLPIKDRVADLLSRMTLEEKVAQMVGVWQGKGQTLVDESGNFDLEKAK